MARGDYPPRQRWASSTALDAALAQHRAVVFRPDAKGAAVASPKNRLLISVSPPCGPERDSSTPRPTVGRADARARFLERR